MSTASGPFWHTYTETESMVLTDPDTLTTTADRLDVWPTTVRDWETDSVRMTRQTWEKLFKS